MFRSHHAADRIRTAVLIIHRAPNDKPLDIHIVNRMIY